MTCKESYEIYKNGKPGEVYGIWDILTGRFVYGIRVSTPEKAYRELDRLDHNGGSYCLRYDARPIPNGYDTHEQAANHVK